jgi:hypothetical protein
MTPIAPRSTGAIRSPAAIPKIPTGRYEADEAHEGMDFRKKTSPASSCLHSLHVFLLEFPGFDPTVFLP